VVRSIRHTVAKESGETVEQVLESGFQEEQATKIIWQVQDYEIPFLEAKVFCTVLLNSGNSKLFVWQWDARWPGPRALTPLTVDTFPLLDPGVELTPGGQSSLWRGKAAVSDYFKRH